MNFYISFSASFSLLAFCLLTTQDIKPVVEPIQKAFTIDGNIILLATFIICLVSSLILTVVSKKHNKPLASEIGKAFSRYCNSITKAHAGVTASYSILLMFISLLSIHKTFYRFMSLRGIIAAIIFYIAVDYLVKQVRDAANDISFENLIKINKQRIKLYLSTIIKIINSLKNITINGF